MFSYPKRYPVKIKIVGLITSPAYQRVKYNAQMFHETRPQIFLQPHFITLLEFDWKEFIIGLCKEERRLAWMRKAEVTVFWNGHFIGDDQEFYNILFHWFHNIHFYSPNTLSYHSMARNEHHKYFKRDPDKSYIYLNILYEGKTGTLLFELHSDLLPKTCAKFMELCLANPLKENNITYLGSYMHRLCVNGWIQGGVLPTSIPKFPDESYAVSHNQRGILSLCNDGKHSNESQFFITFQPSMWMDGYYVAIGRLIEGHYVLNELENCAVANESPVSDIIISNCGVLPYGKGINVRKKFLNKIIKEIKKKFLYLTEKMLDKKYSGSVISLETDSYQSLLARVDVDTNYNHLISRILSSKKANITHKFNIKQYLTAVLLESVRVITEKYKVHEDVIDTADTSSEIFLQERFEKDLYSIQSSPETLRNIIELCKRTNFFKKVRKLQQEVLKLNYEADLTSTDIKISETGITTSITEIFKSSQSIIDESQEKKYDSDSIEISDEIKEEEDDFQFDPIPEILEKLVTDVLAKSNLVRDESVQNELKGSVIKLIKSILDDVIETHIQLESKQTENHMNQNNSKNSI